MREGRAHVMARSCMISKRGFAGLWPKRLEQTIQPGAWEERFQAVVQSRNPLCSGSVPFRGCANAAGVSRKADERCRRVGLLARRLVGVPLVFPASQPSRVFVGRLHSWFAELEYREAQASADFALTMDRPSRRTFLEFV